MYDTPMNYHNTTNTESYVVLFRNITKLHERFSGQKD